MQATLLYIQAKSTALTRRSAGLPAMLTSILIASMSEASFGDIMRDLQKIAGAPIEATQSAKVARLPQVHALNCLKDVFSNSTLGPSTEVFLADTLEIAVDCLDSAT